MSAWENETTKIDVGTAESGLSQGLLNMDAQKGRDGDR